MTLMLNCYHQLQWSDYKIRLLKHTGFLIDPDTNSFHGQITGNEYEDMPHQKKKEIIYQSWKILIHSFGILIFSWKLCAFAN